MRLLLNGKLIPGLDMKVTARNKSKWEDASGSETSTVSIFKGYKPKVISVSLNIKWEDKKDLKTINDLFEAVVNESPQIHTITHPIATALNIRKVQFQGDLGVIENNSLKSWTVNFDLVEWTSVPAKKDERQKNADTDTDGNTSTDTAGNTSTDADLLGAISADDAQKSLLEKAAIYLDNLLAPNETSEKS